MTRIRETLKASTLPEHGVYYAVDIVTGYPAQRFESLADCLDFCCCNNEDYFPVTNNFEYIEQ